MADSTISGLTENTSPLDDDVFPQDTGVTPVTKKIKWSTLKTALASVFIPVASAPTGSIVGTTDTQTLSNKTILTNSSVADSTTTTKKVAFDIAGATASTTTTLDFNQTSARTITFPDATGTVVLEDNTATLTNKRVNPKTDTATTKTSPYALNSDTYNYVAITGLSNDLTFSLDSGTPVSGQKMVIRVTCDGTIRTLTWTGSGNKYYRSAGATLPTALTINKTYYMGFIYNATSNSGNGTWDLVALSND